MSNKEPTVDDLAMALAVEHMKTHQLTKLQADTDGSLQQAVVLIRHGIARNKELIQQLNDLQSYVINNTSASDTFDRIGELLRQHENWAEHFAAELDCSVGVNRRELDTKVPGMVFLKPVE